MEGPICQPDPSHREACCLPGAQVRDVSRKIPGLVRPSDYYLLLVMQVGSDEVVERSPKVIKRDFRELGRLIEGSGEQEEEADEAFYKRLAEFLQSLALVLVGDFNLPGICWKNNIAELKQSRRFLECVEENCLKQLMVTTCMITSAIYCCVTDVMHVEITLRIASPDSSALSCQMANRFKDNMTVEDSLRKINNLSLLPSSAISSHMTQFTSHWKENRALGEENQNLQQKNRAFHMENKAYYEKEHIQRQNVLWEENKILQENHRGSSETKHLEKQQKAVQQQNKALKEIEALKEQERAFAMEEKALQQVILALWEENKDFKEQLKALQKENKAIQEEEKALCEEKNALSEEKIALQEENGTLQDEEKALQSQEKALQEQHKSYMNGILQEEE
ncbi:LOW QUALITY PROTEIN: coiled-coil domain-containing protein 70 [Leptosomus discolor]